LNKYYDKGEHKKGKKKITSKLKIKGKMCRFKLSDGKKERKKRKRKDRGKCKFKGIIPWGWGNGC
jgi:hypothetical protein